MLKGERGEMEDHDARAAAPDLAGRLLSAAGLADRPQEARRRFPAAGALQDLWRVAPEFLEQAQDDATLLAIRDQERAGLDIITDGEQRRESYSNRFATALDGVDIDNPGTTLNRSGKPIPVPRVTGKSAPQTSGRRCATCSSCAPTPTARSR